MQLSHSCWCRAVRRTRRCTYCRPGPPGRQGSERDARRRWPRRARRFGTGRELDDERMRRAELAGTPVYLAPEIFANQPATPSAMSTALACCSSTSQRATFRSRVERWRRCGRHTRRGVRHRSGPHALTSLPSSSPPSIARSTPIPNGGCCPHRIYRAPFRFRRVTEPARSGCASPLRPRVWRRWCSSRWPAWYGEAGSGTETVAFTARDWVLVTSIANRTGETFSTARSTYALERELSQSPFVNVVPRTRIADVLQLMQKPADTRARSGNQSRSRSQRRASSRACHRAAWTKLAMHTA